MSSFRKRLKKILGQGINDADYQVEIKDRYKDENGKWHQKTIWLCPFYLAWRCMLNRALSDNYKTRQPKYKDTTVCDEWLTFSRFKSWMQMQDWQGNELDKDLLGRSENKYSPDNCVFVSNLVNCFMTENKSNKGIYPVGVCKEGKYDRYRAECSQLGEGGKFLGTFKTPEDARVAYCIEKLRLANILALQQSDKRVANALISKYEKLLEESRYEKE